MEEDKKKLNEENKKRVEEEKRKIEEDKKMATLEKKKKLKEEKEKKKQGAMTPAVKNKLSEPNLNLTVEKKDSETNKSSKSLNKLSSIFSKKVKIYLFTGLKSLGAL